jgi:hypothetical protein
MPVAAPASPVGGLLLIEIQKRRGRLDAGPSTYFFAALSFLCFFFIAILFSPFVIGV